MWNRLRMGKPALALRTRHPFLRMLRMATIPGPDRPDLDPPQPVPPGPPRPGDPIPGDPGPADPPMPPPGRPDPDLPPDQPTGLLRNRSARHSDGMHSL